MGFNRGSIRRFEQERLAKEDIRLLIEAVNYSTLGVRLPETVASPTRIELLIGKLKRMEKQG